MDQSRLTTALDILEGFFFRNAASHLRVDTQCRLTKEQTTKVSRVILALAGLTADTCVHDPVDVGLLDEMVDHLRRDYNFTMGVDGLMDLDPLCTWEIHQIIAIEEGVIQNGSEDGDFGGFCQ
jgi:hypothetical protein